MKALNLPKVIIYLLFVLLGALLTVGVGYFFRSSICNYVSSTTEEEDTSEDESTTEELVTQESYIAEDGSEVTVYVNLVTPDGFTYKVYLYKWDTEGEKSELKELKTVYGDMAYVRISPETHNILVYDDPSAEGATAVYIFDEYGTELYDSDTDVNIWTYIVQNTENNGVMAGQTVMGWVDDTTCRFKLSNDESTDYALIHVPSITMEIE